MAHEYLTHKQIFHNGESYWLTERDTERFITLANLHCPNCGCIRPHGVYEQHIAPLHRITIQADCIACRNTRAIYQINTIKG